MNGHGMKWQYGRTCQFGQRMQEGSVSFISIMAHGAHKQEGVRGAVRRSRVAKASRGEEGLLPGHGRRGGRFELEPRPPSRLLSYSALRVSLEAEHASCRETPAAERSLQIL